MRVDSQLEDRIQMTNIKKSIKQFKSYFMQHHMPRGVQNTLHHPRQ